MSRPSKPGISTLTVRPNLNEWMEINILAELDKRNMANELLTILHNEFMKRFPKGLQDYLQQHPEYKQEINGKEAVTNKG
jgi:hypothetical protein